MLAANRPAGVAPEVNLREHISHMLLPSANKAAHSGFETQRRRHQKTKRGVSVAPQKGLMSSKFFFKKNGIISGRMLQTSHNLMDPGDSPLLLM